MWMENKQKIWICRWCEDACSCKIWGWKKLNHADLSSLFFSCTEFYSCLFFAWACIFALSIYLYFWLFFIHISMDFFEAGVQGEEGASENVLEKQSEIFSWPASRSRKSVQTRREDKNLTCCCRANRGSLPGRVAGRRCSGPCLELWMVLKVFGWS